jgi:glucan phosphoethanolaminetransferase (alkaline phosphatase superfamily)
MKRTRDPGSPAAERASPRPARVVALTLSALFIPLAWIGLDLVRRVPSFPPGEPALQRTYAAGALLSLLVWGLGMEAARHPRRAVRLVALAFLGTIAAFGIGLQLFAWALTHAYVGRRAIMLALGIPDLAHAGYFTQAGLLLLALCLVPAGFSIALGSLRHRRFGLRRARPGATAGLALVAIFTALFTPFAAQRIQCLPPDMLWLNGAGGPLLYAAGLQQGPKSLPVGEHRRLPTTAPVEASAPSILLLLGESLRRDALCLTPSPSCRVSPELDEAAPERIGYARAFSVASCTELVSTALFSGLPITASPGELAKAPLLWDYAKARGYRTAYIGSQNLLYQQADLFLRRSRIDLVREARDRAKDASIDEGSPDEATTAEALDFLEGDGPAFVVIHYSNTHVPYRQAPGFTPFPTEGPEGSKNRYRNALAHADFIVGDLLSRLRRSERARRTLVLMTSDHGEAFGEHGSSTHSFDLHAEQIDVPLWLDAPKGTLPEDTRARLARESTSRPVTTQDLSATLLDLLGALDQPAFQAHTQAIAGASLLRPAPTERQVLLWNCPPTRECAAEAFGVVAWPLKLHYVGHELHYACHDLEVDPAERAALPESRCAPLRALLDARFGTRSAPGPEAR